MSRERIMLTQAIPAVQQLRRVQGFDPLRFLKRNANGGIELEPRYQRLWFRLACPDGKMLLNRLRITDQIAVYEAQVFLSREDNQPITNFTAAVEKAQAPAGRYVQAAQDAALKTALDNAGFGIQLCEINPSAAVDAQADGKQEVATGAVNRQETAPAVNGAAAPQREDPIGENHPVQAVPTPQGVQPQEAAKTPNVNQQEVHTAQQTESVSDAMSLLQALSGGTEASEPDSPSLPVAQLIFPVRIRGEALSCHRVVVGGFSVHFAIGAELAVLDHLFKLLLILFRLLFQLLQLILRSPRIGGALDVAFVPVPASRGGEVDILIVNTAEFIVRRDGFVFVVEAAA